MLFRTIKQTMQLRKAHSWTPEASAQELEWGMMGVWLLGLMALQQQVRPNKDGTAVRQWSASETLRLIRRAIRGSMGRGRSLALLRTVRPEEAGQALSTVQTEVLRKEAGKPSRPS